MVGINQNVAPAALKLSQLEVPTEADRKVAQEGLSKLETYLNASAGRSWFPGKLRLVRPPSAQQGQPAEQGVVMKREMWWRKGNQDVRSDTSAYVKNLFKTAYIGKVHPHEFDRLMAKLDTYLEDKGDAFGVKAFRRFSDEFKNAAQAARDGKTGPFSSIPIQSATAAQLVPARDQAGYMDKPQILARWEAGLKALSGQPDSVRLLGAGTEGAAFEFRESGQSLVYKGFFEPKSLSEDPPNLQLNQFSGDIGVARSRALLKSSRIAMPSEFVVSVGPKGGEGEQTRLMRVPAEKLKGLVNALRLPSAQAPNNQTEFEVKQVGILMPRAAGRSVGELASKGPVTDDDIANIATGMTRALQELDSHNTVLHDIKPDNLLYDPSSGGLKLIDLGMAQKLSKGHRLAENGPQKETTTARQAGTDFYMAPDVARSNEFNPIPHGTEVDRYSMAVTLLELLAPGMGKDLEFQQGVINQAVWFDAERGQPFLPQQYLDKWMERIEAKRPQDAATIREKFQKDPDLKHLIQDAFCASERSVEGSQAWARVTSNPLLSRTEARLEAQRNERFDLGAEQARDARAPAPTDAAGISLLSPRLLKLAGGSSVPQEGVYRAGTEIRGEMQRELEADMGKAAQDSSPIQDLENDPRLAKIRGDLDRDLYAFEGLRSAAGGERVVTGISAFKDALSSQFAQMNERPPGSLEERILERDRNRTLTDNALRDLSAFHHQELSANAYFYTGMNYQGKHDYRRPWMGGILDHGPRGDPARRSISPDPANPGSLLIGFSVAVKGVPSGIGGASMRMAYEPLADDPGKRPMFTERMDIQLRYTPSDQAGQVGRVAVLDIRNDFSMVLQDVPPEPAPPI